MPNDKDVLDFGEPVSMYTREQGIEDGMLVLDPLKQLAEDAGFTQPVAFTAGLFHSLTDEADWRAVLYQGAKIWREEVAKRQADPRGTPSSVGPLDFMHGATKVWVCWNAHEAFTFMLPEDY